MNASMKYEFRTSEGRTCCKSDDVEHLCPKCRAAASDVYSNPPDPYREATAKLREAQGITIPEADTDPWVPMMARFREAVYEMTSTSRRAASEPATSDIRTHPPDGYAAALRMK